MWRASGTQPRAPLSGVRVHSKALYYKPTGTQIFTGSNHRALVQTLVRTDLRPANFRQIFFRSRIFVLHFFVAHFFEMIFLSVHFSVFIVSSLHLSVRILHYSSIYFSFGKNFSVCTIFRSYLFSSVYFFIYIDMQNILRNIFIRISESCL